MLPVAPGLAGALLGAALAAFDADAPLAGDAGAAVAGLIALLSVAPDFAGAGLGDAGVSDEPADTPDGGSIALLPVAPGLAGPVLELEALLPTGEVTPVSAAAGAAAPPCPPDGDFGVAGAIALLPVAPGFAGAVAGSRLS